MSFWFPAVVELKSFGFSYVVFGEQYKLNFILVSQFHFEMFEIMADNCHLPFSLWYLCF